MVSLLYRGYVGSIEFIPNDPMMYGQIMRMDDIVTYSGACFDDLMAAFHAAVDAYIEFDDG